MRGIKRFVKRITIVVIVAVVVIVCVAHNTTEWRNVLHQVTWSSFFFCIASREETIYSTFIGLARAANRVCLAVSLIVSQTIMQLSIRSCSAAGSACDLQLRPDENGPVLIVICFTPSMSMIVLWRMWMIRVPLDFHDVAHCVAETWSVWVIVLWMMIEPVPPRWRWRSVHYGRVSSETNYRIVVKEFSGIVDIRVNWTGHFEFPVL